MHRPTSHSKYPRIILGVVLITCVSIYLESEGLFWYDSSYKNTYGLQINITPYIAGKKNSEENTLNTRCSTKDELMKIFRHAGQLQNALRHLLASTNSIFNNNLEKIRRSVRKHQLPLINDIFNTIEEIIHNDDEDLKTLERFVSDRINKLQNPSNCSQARKFICNLDYVAFGLGCILHHLVDCFIIALGTNRTLLADVSGISYKGWSKVYRPLSTCANDDTSTKNITEWKGEKSSNPTPNHILVVKKSVHKNRRHLTPTLSKFVPFAMPTVIADKLSHAHNYPNAWWMGQLFRYVTRLQPWLLDAIDKKMKEIGFSHPIPCLHVRRTDKIIPGVSFRNLSEFMIHVDYWYEQYELKRNTTEKLERKVYLATDDYGAVVEAKTKYTKFKFLHDPLIKEMAGMKKRFSEDGLIYSTSEMMLMSHCDYFVGTLTSNFGRTIYQLMQAQNERTYDTISLDKAFSAMLPHPYHHEAIMEHSHYGDISLKVEDKIALNYNAPPIFHAGRGRNQRTNKFGYYPMMKVKHLLKSEKFAGFE